MSNDIDHPDTRATFQALLRSLRRLAEVHVCAQIHGRDKGVAATDFDREAGEAIVDFFHGLADAILDHGEAAGDEAAGAWEDRCREWSRALEEFRADAAEAIENLTPEGVEPPVITASPPPETAPEHGDPAKAIEAARKIVRAEIETLTQGL